MRMFLEGLWGFVKWAAVIAFLVGMVYTVLFWNDCGICNYDSYP